MLLKLSPKRSRCFREEYLTLFDSALELTLAYDASAYGLWAVMVLFQAGRKISAVKVSVTTTIGLVATFLFSIFTIH